jgi:hypothetical protein
MTPIFPLRHRLSVAIATSTLVGYFSSVAIAQIADVPQPNSHGDFTTAFVQGHRGYYANEKWLAISQSGDRRDAALNCRYAPNGEIRSRIVPGAIVEAVFLGEPNIPGTSEPNWANDAIVLENGVPWLRVRGTSGLFDPARAGDFESLGECYVRANQQYIAPVNNDWSREWR